MPPLRGRYATAAFGGCRIQGECPPGYRILYITATKQEKSVELADYFNLSNLKFGAIIFWTKFVQRVHINDENRYLFRLFRCR